MIHPTRIVRFNFMAMFLGTSIAIAVDRAMQNFSWPLLFGFAAFILQSLNFFHGKVITLEDEHYNAALINRPNLALADFAMNTSLFFSLAVMGFAVVKPVGFLIASIVVRILDIPLVLLTRSVAVQPQLRKAHRFWLIIDLIAAVYLAILWLILTTSPQSILRYSSVLYLAVLIIILVDIGVLDEVL